MANNRTSSPEQRTTLQYVLLGGLLGIAFQGMSFMLKASYANAGWFEALATISYLLVLFVILVKLRYRHAAQMAQSGTLPLTKHQYLTRTLVAIPILIFTATALGFLILVVLFNNAK